MLNTSAKAACEQLPKQKTYAPQKNSNPLSFFRSIEKIQITIYSTWQRKTFHLKFAFKSKNKDFFHFGLFN